METSIIWKPEHDGHAPPFWQDGMVCQVYHSIRRRWIDMNIPPSWQMAYQYRVPPEAVNPPFDPEVWLADGLANLDKLPAGVVLPEPTDWAMRVAEDFWSRPAYYVEELAEHIRTHCQPKLEE